MPSITLYNLCDYVDGHLNAVTLDLTDCITSDDYLAKVSQGLWDIAAGCGHIHITSVDDCITANDYLAKVSQDIETRCNVISSRGNVLSSRCTCCDHIHIASVMSECNSCGSNEIETKMTGEEWIIADYEGIPARYVGTYDLDSDYFEYKKALEESGMTADAFNAGISCGLNPNEIVDAYQGEYSNDEDFAIHCADGMGVFDEAAAWPYSCIDWERAAREIMDDFTVENGHYFSLT